MAIAPIQTYIGDGVYMEYTGIDFHLFTSNGISQKDHIYLELEHLENIARFAAKVIADIQCRRSSEITDPMTDPEPYADSAYDV